MAFGLVSAADRSPVCLVGELDLSTSLALKDLDGSSPLILDVSGLTFIDSAGTHALEDVALRVGRLVLVSPQPNVLRVFDIVWPERPDGIEIRRPGTFRAVKTLRRSTRPAAAVRSD